MKSSKLSFISETIIKLVIIVALIISALTKQQYSFFIFIRWFVMISFIYFFYVAYKNKIIGLLFYYGAIAVMFNPIKKIWFQKETWHLIDYSVAFITLLTIIYDWYKMYVKQKVKT